ncbi:MAG TPA: ABC transporter permease [Micromonosporaceae bacterium]|nr:ABC transporter permease [Micromonosporaceae bacterium]
MSATTDSGVQATAGTPVEPDESGSGQSLSHSRLVLRRFLRQRTAVLGIAVILMLVFFAYIGPFFYPWSYDQLDFQAMQAPPSLEHWFGTYQIGGDVFAKTMRGLQKSLVIGLLGALFATVLAAVVGAFAGYFGGRTDLLARLSTDLMLVLPGFLIIAILSPAFRGRTWLLFVVLLAAFQWMITSRVVRGMTQSLREREFVQAARFMGVPGRKIIFRHILPNMASLLIIDFTVGVSSIILAEVGLSFFGFGVQPPDVSLGTLIADGSGAALTNWWQFYFPSGVLVLLVLAVNLVGDGLRDALDPNADTGSGK